MTQFRVFLGAPSAAELRRAPSSYQWQTVSSLSSASTSVIFPPATLAAASRRISLMYQNIIFGEAGEDDQEFDEGSQEESRKQGNQTTLFTWPPTEPGNNRTGLDSSILPSMSASRPQNSLLETQETQETASYNYSDASSIGRFPAFSFSLHALTSLSALTAMSKGGKGSRKVAILAAVLEVEGPDTITIKQGKDAGKQVSLLKMILGDEDGNVCKLTAWREIADAWGGNVASPAVKRGDILFIENVTASWEPGSSVSLTASPFLKSKLDICYRTMPYTHEDKRLRPDLRLGFSDAAVRKVGSVVKWFEGMAGLDAEQIAS